ncbi:MAG TPA: c-type cytochrome [Candidatus Methylomirabilis sp.]|nr:c-type cytochrome [Candidatus Methylomirabilis sp.]
MLVGAALLSLTLPVTAAQRPGGPPTQLDVLVAQGKQVYDRYCVGCHGANGDGKGPAARLLIVKPRDFTKGVFKFRSTPSWTLPTDEDLYKIITRGVYRTSMPDWGLVPERDRLAVLQYIKTFYPEWKAQGSGKPIFIPEPPETLRSPESVARGKELYTLLECTACHGASGRGDGPSAATLDPDTWGNKQKPFDFTQGRLKSGPTAKDVYRTFMTGVGGTAMPSYADIFGEPDGENIKEGDAWHLVSYVLSLRRPASGGEKRAETSTPAKGRPQ